MMYFTRPPKNAVSVPGRRATWVSAISAVRLRSGSTTIQCAPASRARSIQRSVTGWDAAWSDPTVRITFARGASLISPSGASTPKDARQAAAKARRPNTASLSRCTTPQLRRAFASRYCSSATRRAPPKLAMASVRITGTSPTRSTKVSSRVFFTAAAISPMAMSQEMFSHRSLPGRRTRGVARRKGLGTA